MCSSGGDEIALEVFEGDRQQLGDFVLTSVTGHVLFELEELVDGQRQDMSKPGLFFQGAQGLPHKAVALEFRQHFVPGQKVKEVLFLLVCESKRLARILFVVDRQGEPKHSTVKALSWVDDIALMARLVVRPVLPNMCTCCPVGRELS